MNEKNRRTRMLSFAIARASSKATGAGPSLSHARGLRQLHAGSVHHLHRVKGSRDPALSSQCRDAFYRNAAF